MFSPQIGWVSPLHPGSLMYKGQSSVYLSTHRYCVSVSTIFPWQYLSANIEITHIRACCCHLRDCFFVTFITAPLDNFGNSVCLFLREDTQEVDGFALLKGTRLQESLGRNSPSERPGFMLENVWSSTPGHHCQRFPPRRIPSFGPTRQESSLEQ